LRRLGVVVVAPITTTGSARRVPLSLRTASARDAGTVVGAVKGPSVPARTSQASAWKESTVRRISLSKLALTPESSSPRAKTSAVATTAIANLRRRHWRSRRLTSQATASPFPLSLSDRSRPINRSEEDPESAVEPYL
jgi:hypothetical protein